ncbi:MAG: metallophosphoesterase [Herpetosiphon sp.]
MGDFCDRGPAGIEVIDLVMRLQGESAATGGEVGAILGNHDLLLMAVDNWGGGWMANWKEYGGQIRDLNALNAAHRNWLAGRPAMALVDDALLIHADTTRYGEYGHTVAAVNDTVSAILGRPDPDTWDQLLDVISDRLAFYQAGRRIADPFLRSFGARRLIHGHTPIHNYTGQRPRDITKPLIYAGGRCIAIDGGIYKGGPGFVYRLPHLPPDDSVR